MCQNCEINDCSCGDLQIPRGNTGATGATGQQGGAGTNGTNGTTILYQNALDVLTQAAASPQTLRTFQVTPAMFTGGSIGVDCWTECPSGVSVGIAVTVFFGGQVVGAWVGIPTANSAIHIQSTIMRISNVAQRSTSTILKGINIFNAWSVTGQLQDLTVDLTVNNNLTVVVTRISGAFTAGEMVSKTFLVTKFN